MLFRVQKFASWFLLLDLQFEVRNLSIRIWNIRSFSKNAVLFQNNAFPFQNNMPFHFRILRFGYASVLPRNLRFRFRDLAGTCAAPYIQAETSLPPFRLVRTENTIG